MRVPVLVDASGYVSGEEKLKLCQRNLKFLPCPRHQCALRATLLHFLYGFSGMFIQYLCSDRRIVGEHLIPSFITNIPCGQQRAHIMALLYPWMCGFPDERDPLVRECYSFLRTAWYLPKGLP